VPGIPPLPATLEPFQLKLQTTFKTDGHTGATCRPAGPIFNLQAWIEGIAA
jgi:hypothetical protein